MATLSNCTSALGRPSDAARGKMDRLDAGGAGGSCLCCCWSSVNTPPGRQAHRMADAETDRRHGPPRRHCRPVPRRAAGRAGRTARPAGSLRHGRGPGTRLVAAATAAPAHRDRPARGGPHRGDTDADRVVLRQRGPADAGHPARVAGCTAGRRSGIGRRRRCRRTGRLGRTRLADRFQREPERPPDRWRGQLCRDRHGRRHTAAGHAARERAGPWPARKPGRAARPGRGGDRCESRRTT